MPNKLAAYRLPEELLAEINRIAMETSQDKTAIVIQLIKSGLSSLSSNTVVIQRITPLSREELENRLATFEAQLTSRLDTLETRMGSSKGEFKSPFTG